MLFFCIVCLALLGLFILFQDRNTKGATKRNTDNELQMDQDTQGDLNTVIAQKPAIKEDIHRIDFWHENEGEEWWR
ncbi:MULTISPECIES: hypothetical protein [Aminobacterium]|jgi:hypothetical protein|uniref:hypothetical protein n=1 Tax=Aminobacterium TaxID=81466 RepID=UPI002579F249|nr:hypothetical protein [Aminobacterium sp. UBA4987]